MKKSFYIIFFFFILLTRPISKVFAKEITFIPTQMFYHNTTISSSAFTNITQFKLQEKEDERKEKLKYFLTLLNSPLLPYLDDLIDAADLYGIPYTLIPSIAGVESTFCHKAPLRTFNCWGWNNGVYTFENYHRAIYEISRALRLNYFDRGRTSPELIGPIYAPPSPKWAGNVRFFMSQIESRTIANPTLQINL